jgi:hypothetical protein
LIAIRHFPADPDKEAFHRYLRDFSAVECEVELLASLSKCSDVLPNECADQLALPPGSTYRDAVQLLLCPWTTTMRAPGGVSFE